MTKCTNCGFESHGAMFCSSVCEAIVMDPIHSEMAVHHAAADEAEERIFENAEMAFRYAEGSQR